MAASISTTADRPSDDPSCTAVAVDLPRIRVAIAYLGFYRNSGGERRILQLLRGLDQRYYDVTLITLRINSSEVWRRIETLGVNTIRLDQSMDQPLPHPRQPIAMLRTLWDVYAAIRKTEPHILQVQGMNMNSLSRLAGWLARVPAIVSVENWVYPPPPSGLKYIKYWLKQRLSITLDRRSQAIIAITSPFAEEKKRLGIRTPCVVIPSPMDLTAFLRGRSVRPFAKPLQDPQRIRLGFLGRLAPEKGARYAIEALVEVRKLYPQAELILIGAGPEESALRAQVAELGLDEHVTFRGLQEDVCGELCNLDLFVMPSVLEAYAQVFLEAMAVALPVVATRTIGSQEFFPKEMHDELVEPANSSALAAAILKMLHDPEMARSQAATLHLRGAKIASEKRFIEAHDKLYRGVLEKQGLKF